MKYAPALFFLFGSEILSMFVVLYFLILFLGKVLMERADRNDG